MQLTELLLRMVGVFLVFELLVLGLNPLPETIDQWCKKRRTVLRRIFYYVACLLAAIWVATL